MDSAVTQNDWGQPPVNVKKRRSRVRLDSVGDARREAARIYRKAVSGDIDVADASKLANILALIGRMIETSDLESRLSALEAGER